MRKSNTTTTDTFTAANGAIISFQDMLDIIETEVEIYGRTWGKYLSASELEDLSQDIVCKAVRYCGTFDPRKSKLKTWVSRIAHNVETDTFNRFRETQDRFSHFEIYDEDGEQGESFIDNVPGGYLADSEVEERDVRERVNAAVNSLGGELRYVINLKDQDFEPREMAKRLGCTPGAASVLLFRARKSLRQKLGESTLAECGMAA